MAGRGEPARLIMTAAGVKFVDNRVKMEDWPSMKSTLEWGQLPVLQVGDTKTLTQSKTIFRYLARKFKLTGADEWEAAKCNELVDAMGDVIEEFVAITFKEPDAEKKKERQKTFSTVTVPAFLSKINKVQMENEGQWMVGKNMTWADIVLAESLRQLCEMDPSALNGYPHVRKMYEAVWAQERIKQYRNAMAK